MTIAILQNGIRRNFKVCQENHSKFYNILQDIYGIKVYDFYKSDSKQKQKFNSGGKIQLYDLLENSKNIEEDIFIKVRSDIFITTTAQQVIIKEIEKVISNQIDIIFLGTNIHNDYNQTYKIYEDTKSCSRLNDFVIIVRKSCLPNYDSIKNSLINGNDHISGNVYFHLLINDNVRASNVSTQIYIVRSEPKNVNDNWEIYYTWAQSYMYNAVKQHNWIRDKKNIIRAY